MSYAYFTHDDKESTEQYKTKKSDQSTKNKKKVNHQKRNPPKISRHVFSALFS